ncbi:hypothetical protein BCR43DRAFT_511638 [Syncephalastrum racemosum]|uniref:Uncharacterized protein n=1 Tax=Syncephalastrum racemosum TaxID=13706 RepID=A0A1X2HMP1_SYNRA|nr:hypothetical protein BCR43DRAFT_511638 [Syncephalastrum racemosum]
MPPLHTKTSQQARLDLWLASQADSVQCQVQAAHNRPIPNNDNDILVATRDKEGNAITCSDLNPNDSYTNDDSTADDATVRYSIHKSSDEDEQEDLLLSTEELSIPEKPLTVPAGTHKYQNENNDQDDDESQLLSSEDSQLCLAHIHERDQHGAAVDLPAPGIILGLPYSRPRITPIRTTPSETQNITKQGALALSRRPQLQHDSLDEPLFLDSDEHKKNVDPKELRQHLPQQLGRDESLLCLEDSGQSDIQCFSPTSLSSIASQPEQSSKQVRKGSEGRDQSQNRTCSEEEPYGPENKLTSLAYSLDDRSEAKIQHIAADYAAQSFFSDAAKQAARSSMVPTSDSEEEHETGDGPPARRRTIWDGFMSSWSDPSSQESCSSKLLPTIPSRHDQLHPEAPHRQTQKQQATLSFHPVVRAPTTQSAKAAPASLKRHASEDTRTKKPSKSKQRANRIRK